MFNLEKYDWIEHIERLENGHYLLRISFFDRTKSSNKLEMEKLPQERENTWVTETCDGRFIKDYLSGDITIDHKHLKKLIISLKERSTEFVNVTEKFDILYRSKTANYQIDNIHQAHNNLYKCILHIWIKNNLLPKEDKKDYCYIVYTWGNSGEEKIKFQAISGEYYFTITPGIIPNYHEIIEYLFYKSKDRIKLLQMGVKPRSFA